MSLRIKIDKLRQIVAYFSEFSEEVSINVDYSSNLMYVFAALGGSVNIWAIVPLSASVFYDGKNNQVFNLPVSKVKSCLCSFHNDAIIEIEPDIEHDLVKLSSYHVVSVDCNKELMPIRTDTCICLKIDQKKSYIFNFHKYEEKCCARTVIHLELLLGFIKCISQYQYLSILFRNNNIVFKTPGNLDTFSREYSMTEYSPELQKFSFKMAIASLNKLRGFKKRVNVFETRIVMDKDDNVLGMLFSDRLPSFRINIFMSFHD
ncbi:SPV055 putative late transcription factor VLTF-1 [Swinepox virus]|uniref:Late transcription factor 1 n=1 Tax=Swinepox virus (strain Swine/Nebraska/17077-99/1999) TaxID=300880 RepID=Q8V3N9_SWPV1|nr:late transcription factor VLTF-1 [Swinepox virus]AAL69794.1 SPV055 putative late transcription factor VLTF-1 [Swinepox virus]UUA44245.1 SPV055 [Swinepox virus]